jgi:hypothetical protein
MSNRFVLCALLCVLLFSSPHLKAAPNTKAGARKKDIQCSASGQYIGAFDRTYKLTISGPKPRKWEYTVTVSPPMANGDSKAGGMYELVDDLAIFTGKSGQDEIRFGLNYGFPGDKVEFNGFFPGSDKVLRHHRKWFQKAGGKWKAVEELTLTMPRVLPGKNEWKVRFQGERIRWDKDGKKTRERIDQTLTFKKPGEGFSYYTSDKKPSDRVPAILIPKVAGKRLAAVLLSDHSSGHPQVLRGFHPSLAVVDTNR